MTTGIGGVVLACLVIALLSGCAKPVAVDDIVKEPKHVPADSAFQGKMSPWDGIWQGQSLTYEDFGGQKEGTTPPSSPDMFESLVLQLAVSKSVGLTAQFISVSPFFQKTVLEESVEKNGALVKDQYRGIRKVQDGKLLWVVHRAGAASVMEGEAPSENRLVWRRKSADGRVTETRYETLKDGAIHVTGWFYGEGDDTSRAPRFWVRATLKRAEVGIKTPKYYE
jgi:hypothetical protein